MFARLLIKIAVLTILTLVQSHPTSIENSSEYSEVSLESRDNSNKEVEKVFQNVPMLSDEHNTSFAAPCHKEPVDCADVFGNDNKINGVYEVHPKSKLLPCGSLKVYCDMTTDGGGWTVIQRRGDYKRHYNYFNKTWNEYKVGFGSLSKDFWLGNNNIYILTNQKKYSVRFDLGTVQGEKAYATYDDFWIENEELKYRLYITGYSGTAGDAMFYNRGEPFTTKDRDNDKSKDNCAVSRGGGWWHYDCTYANLNGLYFKGNHSQEMKNTTVWSQWKGNKVSLASVEIKIRPLNFLEK